MLTHRQLFLQHLAQTSDSPAMLEIESASGIYLFDASGKKYVDLISGIGVSNIGHCHPNVISAIEKQIKKYMHLMVYGEYVQLPQVQFAKLITDHLPATLDCVYFTNSGTEATEGAIKLAKKLTGRQEIISFRNSYHGSTQGALSVVGNEDLRNSFRPLIPGNRLLNFNAETELDQITVDTAAVILEPVQAEAGVISADMAFLQKIRTRCYETGAIMILDECQTAFGRTGSLFCFEQYKIIPDILLLAKSLGGGMPLGAFISSNERMSSLSKNPALGHITTFGGHPVCCAAGKAALQVLLGGNLIAEALIKGKLFKSLLQHERINKFNSAGLMMSLEFDDEAICKKSVNECIQRGIITDWFLFAPHCMRLAPPLIITEAEINHCCSVILQSLDSV